MVLVLYRRCGVRNLVGGRVPRHPVRPFDGVACRGRGCRVWQADRDRVAPVDLRQGVRASCVPLLPRPLGASEPGGRMTRGARLSGRAGTSNSVDPPRASPCHRFRCEARDQEHDGRRQRDRLRPRPLHPPPHFQSSRFRREAAEPGRRPHGRYRCRSERRDSRRSGASRTRAVSIEPQLASAPTHREDLVRSRLAVLRAGSGPLEGG